MAHKLALVVNAVLISAFAYASCCRSRQIQKFYPRHTRQQLILRMSHWHINRFLLWSFIRHKLRRMTMRPTSGTTTSIWTATAEAPSEQTLNKDLSANVCIVGAGLAGLTTG